MAAVVADENTILVATDLMDRNSTTHQFPFKVHQTEWNPTKELLAVASQKGEVSVRRLQWKRGWKTDIYDSKPLLVSTNGDNKEIEQMQTMCWSPDGNILAVSFRDGYIHLLDVEKGVVRFTVKLMNYAVQMKWQTLCSNKKKVNIDSGGLKIHGDWLGLDENSEKFGGISQLRAMKNFSEEILPESAIGTILCVTDSENVVHVLAAGVLPIVEIEPPMELFGNCDPYSLGVNELYYDQATEYLMVVYSYVGRSTESDAINKLGYGMNTHLVGFDIDTAGCLKNGTLWKIASRWVQINFSLAYVTEAYARMIGDWNAQSSNFSHQMSRFAEKVLTDKDCTLDECLINLVLNGQTSSHLTNFFRNVLKPPDWKKMTDWVEQNFSTLIQIMGSQVIQGIKYVLHNMQQLKLEVDCALHKTKHVKILPKRVFDVDVYPYGKFDVDEVDFPLISQMKKIQKLVEDVFMKVHEVYIIAIRNRSDLMNLTHWLTQTPSFTVKRKKPEDTGQLNARYDLQTILDYLTQTLKPLQTFETEQKSSQTDESSNDDAKSRLSNQNEKATMARNDYVFDMVCQYFDETKPLKYRLDISSSAWRDPQIIESINSLSKCISNCVDGMQSIQENIMKTFSSAIPKKNTVLESCSVEGFENIRIFALDVDRTKINQSDERKQFIQQFGGEHLAISCIGPGGNRHSIFGLSGKIIREWNYDIIKIWSANFELSTVGGLRGKCHKNEQANQEVSEPNETIASSSSMMREKAEAKSAPEPLTVQVPTETSARRRKHFSPGAKIRQIQFEWCKDGVYYGLMRIIKDTRTETVLFRSCLWHNTLYIHEDNYSFDSYYSLSVSAQLKMGIAISEFDSRVRLFEIDDYQRRDSVSSTTLSKSLLKKTRMTEIGQKIAAEKYNLRKGKKPKDGNQIDTGELKAPTTASVSESVNLRRSERKRKPIRD